MTFRFLHQKGGEVNYSPVYALESGEVNYYCPVLLLRLSQLRALTLKGAAVFYSVKVRQGAKNAPPLDQPKNGVKSSI